MALNIEDVIKAWQRATDRDVIQAATIDKNEYPAEVQAVIDGEVESRGLNNEVAAEMVKLSKKPVKPKSKSPFEVHFQKSTPRKLIETIVLNILVIAAITVVVQNVDSDSRQLFYGIGAILLLIIDFRIWR